MFKNYIKLEGSDMALSTARERLLHKTDEVYVAADPERPGVWLVIAAGYESEPLQGNFPSHEAAVICARNFVAWALDVKRQFGEDDPTTPRAP